LANGERKYLIKSGSCFLFSHHVVVLPERDNVGRLLISLGGFGSARFFPSDRFYISTPKSVFPTTLLFRERFDPNISDNLLPDARILSEIKFS